MTFMYEQTSGQTDTTKVIYHAALRVVNKNKTRRRSSFEAFQLEAPDVTPVVLGFHYEFHHAPAYKFNNSATFADQ